MNCFYMSLKYENNSIDKSYNYNKDTKCNFNKSQIFLSEYKV